MLRQALEARQLSLRVVSAAVGPQTRENFLAASRAVADNGELERPDPCVRERGLAYPLAAHACTLAMRRVLGKWPPVAS